MKDSRHFGNGCINFVKESKKKTVLLHKGPEVDKENPELPQALSELYKKYFKYEPENVYKTFTKPKREHDQIKKIN